MGTRRRRVVSLPQTAFWDTSGIVSLCCFQPQSTQAVKAARVFSRFVVWWATPVEAASAFHRLAREKYLTKDGLAQTLRRLAAMRQRWSEIQATDEVRDHAERLVGIHKLRAADALQLSAAHVWSNYRCRGRHFVSFDGKLADAAEMDGFTVIRLI